VVGWLKVLAGLKIGATIAGYASLLLPLKTALAAIPGLVAAVLTGPVGITVLVTAALVGLVYIFREQISAFITGIGEFLNNASNLLTEGFKALVQAYFDYWVKPMTELAKGLWQKVVELAQGGFDGIVELFNKLPESIKAPFVVVGNVIKNLWNGILTYVTNSLNSFIQKVNFAINLSNRLLRTNIQPVDLIQAPQEAPSFAGGGYTGNGPRTGGVDGKGGFSVAMQPAQINITTGPVMQADGQNWVTVADLQRAMRATESATMARLRTYAGRRAVGVA
jgi:hypothetical protein